MPRVGFESTISAGERPQTYALDRAATGTGATTTTTTTTTTTNNNNNNNNNNICSRRSRKSFQKDLRAEIQNTRNVEIAREPGTISKSFRHKNLINISGKQDINELQNTDILINGQTFRKVIKWKYVANMYMHSICELNCKKA